jgi:hypothetical protein
MIKFNTDQNFVRQNWKLLEAPTKKVGMQLFGIKFFINSKTIIYLVFLLDLNFFRLRGAQVKNIGYRLKPSIDKILGFFYFFCIPSVAKLNQVYLDFLSLILYFQKRILRREQKNFSTFFVISFFGIIFSFQFRLLKFWISFRFISFLVFSNIFLFVSFLKKTVSFHFQPLITILRYFEKYQFLGLS